MWLSSKTGNSLIEKEIKKYGQKVKDIIVFYVSNIYSPYVKSENLNRFNLLMCEKLHNLFIDFIGTKQAQKEELERRLKNIDISIISNQDRLDDLEQEKNEKEDEYPLDKAKLTMITLIESGITKLEREIDEEKKRRNKQMKEYREFLVDFEDSKQIKFSDEFKIFVICEFEKTNYFKSYGIKQLLSTMTTEIKIEGFHYIKEIYQEIYQKRIEYLVEKEKINDKYK